MKRYLLDLPEGQRHGFAKLFVGEPQFLDYDRWLLANHCPADLLETFPAGTSSRMLMNCSKRAGGWKRAPAGARGSSVR